MRIQLLSDLHLESETFAPRPAPDADVLILAGDVDAGHVGLAHFANWPVPVVYIAGNHEFDGRDFNDAHAALRARCASLGIRMLERESLVLEGRGTRVRFLGTTLWTDFNLFGESESARCQRAGKYYFERIQRSTRDGSPMTTAAIRAESVICREWLRSQLESPAGGAEDYDRTVVITHFAPTLRSNDTRYPVNAATASFCNALDAMVEYCDLWLHGHLHCRHDYRVGTARVVCNARGHASKGEDYDFRPLLTLDV